MSKTNPLYTDTSKFTFEAISSVDIKDNMSHIRKASWSLGDDIGIKLRSKIQKSMRGKNLKSIGYPDTAEYKVDLLVFTKEELLDLVKQEILQSNLHEIKSIS